MRFPGRRGGWVVGGRLLWLQGRWGEGAASPSLPAFPASGGWGLVAKPSAASGQSLVVGLWLNFLLGKFPVPISPGRHASFLGRKRSGPGIPKPFKMQLLAREAFRL